MAIRAVWPAWIIWIEIRAVNGPSQRFTVPREKPYLNLRLYSKRLLVPSAFTVKTLLRQYAKCAFKHRNNVNQICLHACAVAASQLVMFHYFYGNTFSKALAFD